MAASFKELYSKDLLTGIKYAKISVTTGGAGDGTLVAAVTGRIIRVYQVALFSTAALSVTFQSGTGGTALTGDIPLGVNGGFEASFNPAGHFQTASGVLLNLHLSAAGTVGGWLTYAEIE